MRIGINGSDKLASPDLGQIVTDIEAAESEGFSSYWLAQTALVDATTVLGFAGTSTSSIELGTAVVPTWERHPHALAGQALTAQAMAGGRLTLGIGLSHRPVVEGMLRMEWERPVRHMIDYLDVLQPLLTDGKASHQGEVWSYMGSGGRPTDQAPKVMLAALGEQMLRLASKRTDGTILWCVGPKTIEQQILPVINGAATEAGRPAPSIVCSLPVWVTDDVTTAKTFVGTILKDYAALPRHRGGPRCRVDLADRERAAGRGWPGPDLPIGSDGLHRRRDGRQSGRGRSRAPRAGRLLRLMPVRQPASSGRGQPPHI
jgi:F420-dependent oxidoreductase-like protein